MKPFFAAALLLAVLLSACVPLGTLNSGRVVFLLTDDAKDMNGVTRIKLTVDSVQAHRAENGWIAISSTPQMYDLLELKASGTSVLLADTQLKEGKYNQVRLHISKLIVTDADGDHVAKLPSNDLKLVSNLNVEKNQTSIVTFDFIADESLHLTGDGTYVFAPVIHLQSMERANVDVTARNDVRINDGEVDDYREAGMDLDGNFTEGFKLKKDAILFIEGNNIKEGFEIKD